MNKPKLLLIATFFTGAIASLAMATSHAAGTDDGLIHEAAAARAEVPTTLEHQDLYLRIFGAGGEVRLTEKELGLEAAPDRALAAGKPTACGDSVPVASPDNGISGQGCANAEADAVVLAGIDAIKKMLAYSGVTCADCEDPDQCLRWISFLDDQFEVFTYQTGGQWCAVVTYKGPYFVGCTPCDV